jgi:hypothetical protein
MDSKFALRVNLRVHREPSNRILSNEAQLATPSALNVGVAALSPIRH